MTSLAMQALAARLGAGAIHLKAFKVLAVKMVSTLSSILAMVVSEISLGRFLAAEQVSSKVHVEGVMLKRTLI